MINNLTHYKLIILNNDFYKYIYNIEIIILIIPKITLVNYNTHVACRPICFNEGLWVSHRGHMCDKKRFLTISFYDNDFQICQHLDDK